MYYNVNITNQFTTKYLSVNAYFFNELGYRKYFDSIGLKNEDNYYYKFDVNSPMYENLNFSVSYQVKSQFWNSWEYSSDTLHKKQGDIVVFLFFTRVYYLLSRGIL